MKSTIRLFCFVVFISISFLNAIGQEIPNGLIITEIMLDIEHNDVWIEIFNTTENPIVLNSMRTSNVRSLNILPPEAKKSGGYVINKNEFLIMCGSKNTFVKLYGDCPNLIEVNSLLRLDKGGFIVINNLDKTITSGNLVRFGKNDLSKAVVDIIPDSEVLEFRNDNKSYSRIKTTAVLTNWTISNPSPGK